MIEALISFLETTTDTAVLPGITCKGRDPHQVRAAMGLKRISTPRPAFTLWRGRAVYGLDKVATIST
jgi:hypothetical protein